MEQVESQASTRTPTAITMTLSLAMLLASLGTSIANIALPTLTEAFSAPFAEVQAVVVAYLAALTVSVIIAGRLGDHFGLKPMLVVGLVIFIVASLLCAISPGLWPLVGARLLQGVGAAFLMTLAMALMRQTADEARIGRAMGVLGTVSALGTALGPALGGLLIPVTGWRGIFWVQVPVGAVAALLAVVALPNEPRKAETEPTNLRALIDRALMPTILVNMLVAAVMMTTLVVGPFFLSLGLALAASHVGLVMAVGPAISIFSGVPSGRLVDSWGSRRVLATGLALLTAGAVMLAFAPESMGVVGYLLSIAVLTPGYQLFQAANNTVALADVPRDRRGMVSGMLNLSRNIGLIAGASLMGAIFAFGVGTEDFAEASPADIAEGMQLTFLLAGGMMIAAIGIVSAHRNATGRRT
ncbi:MFS transporter [Pleomorphomonas diazotrophica]|uniref:MFS transporter n=1 Tax=Pleomorphomonas diazotrophica TaxID=1166257 RepID=A0A1I4QD04_9HYPH|nr:MFS transporter [Pleomorphomonas diazotrophica]PKR90752.1 MFS transporter [Pleomorphomonas diazotrophica]SFM37982.1 Predicted arabinose efflux permease, MFS family [Pleomorphomonas diazotrophica]